MLKGVSAERMKLLPVSSFVLMFIMISFSAGLAQPQPVRFKSEKPAYSKIALTEDEQRVLLLAFDESGGTGSGYDIVYADTNFNGVLEASEKLQPQGDGTGSYVLMKPVVFPFPYNKHGQGVEQPLVLTLNRSPLPYGGGNGFTANLQVRLLDGDNEWQYTMRGRLQMYMDVADVLAQSTQPLTAKVTLPPEPERLGVAVTLAAGDFTLNCRTPEGNPRVRVQVLNRATQAVASDQTVPLDRLGYG